MASKDKGCDFCGSDDDTHGFGCDADDYVPVANLITKTVIQDPDRVIKDSLAYAAAGKVLAEGKCSIDFHIFPGTAQPLDPCECGKAKLLEDVYAIGTKSN